MDKGINKDVRDSTEKILNLMLSLVHSKTPSKPAGTSWNMTNALGPSLDAAVEAFPHGNSPDLPQLVKHSNEHPVKEKVDKAPQCEFVAGCSQSLCNHHPSES